MAADDPTDTVHAALEKVLDATQKWKDKQDAFIDTQERVTTAIENDYSPTEIRYEARGMGWAKDSLGRAQKQKERAIDHFEETVENLSPAEREEVEYDVYRVQAIKYSEED
jgi:cytochrome c556